MKTPSRVLSNIRRYISPSVLALPAKDSSSMMPMVPLNPPPTPDFPPFDKWQMTKPEKEIEQREEGTAVEAGRHIRNVTVKPLLAHAAPTPLALPPQTRRTTGLWKYISEEIKGHTGISRAC